MPGSTVNKVAIDDATPTWVADIAVKNAEYALKHARLTAPFDALVATRILAKFTTIAAGAPVVRLHDMSEVRITVEVFSTFGRAQSASGEFVCAKPASPG